MSACTGVILLWKQITWFMADAMECGGFVHLGILYVGNGTRIINWTELIVMIVMADPRCNFTAGICFDQGRVLAPVNMVRVWCRVCNTAQNQLCQGLSMVHMFAKGM